MAPGSRHTPCRPPPSGLPLHRSLASHSYGTQLGAAAGFPGEGVSLRACGSWAVRVPFGTAPGRPTPAGLLITGSPGMPATPGVAEASSELTGCRVPAKGGRQPIKGDYGVGLPSTDAPPSRPPRPHLPRRGGSWPGLGDWRTGHRHWGAARRGGDEMA